MATTKKTTPAAKKPDGKNLPWEEQAKRKAGTKKAATAKETPKAADSTAAKLAERAAKGAKAAAAVPEEPKYKYPDGWKPPRTLALAADKLYETRQKRLAMQKDVDALETEEKALKQYLLENLPKDSASGIAGKVARVTATSKDVPRVEDWSKVYAHIVTEYTTAKRKKSGLEDGAFALLGRSIGKKAVEEAWKDNKVIPGVGSFTVNDISINKV